MHGGGEARWCWIDKMVQQEVRDVIAALIMDFSVLVKVMW